jgi:hypothetical protein
MYDVALFQSRIEDFPNEYKEDFDNFWKWKVNVEIVSGNSILDDRHIIATYYKLCEVLPKWQTYSPLGNTPCLKILKTSLNNISEVYSQLGKFSLLDFGQIPRNLLTTI